MQLKKRFQFNDQKLMLPSWRKKDSVASLIESKLKPQRKRGELRDQVIGLIDQYPGSTAVFLTKKMQEAYGAKLFNLPRYVKAGYIKQRKQDGKTRYYLSRSLRTSWKNTLV